jgi:hypothetical protein
MGNPFTPQRLENIRRLRKARRLFKQTPLFAFHLMKQDYPDYTNEQFVDDLRRRSKTKQKKSKTTLCRYGRYNRFLSLTRQFQDSGDQRLAEQAMQLRRNMTKPYRVLVRCGRESREFSLSPLIPFRDVEELNRQLCTCQTMLEAVELVENFRKTNPFH